MSTLLSLVVAIDGPVASGKSTVARAIAQRFDLFHLSVGALHRANAWALNSLNIDLQNEQAISDNMKSLTIHVEKSRQEYQYFANNQNVTKKIFSSEIGELASRLALVNIVEESIHALAHQIITAQKRAILDGRGLNSIFPNANIKVYLTAAEYERAIRYQKFLSENNIQTSFNELYAQILSRDLRDQMRQKHPLIVSEDAFVIDTTQLTIDEVVAKIGNLVKQWDADQQRYKHQV